MMAMSKKYSFFIVVFGLIGLLATDWMLHMAAQTEVTNSDDCPICLAFSHNIEPNEPPAPFHTPFVYKFIGIFIPNETIPSDQHNFSHSARSPPIV
jgi:hypothetical protein